MSAAMDMDIPTGFTPLFRTSPVLELIGPPYGRAVFLIAGPLAGEPTRRA